MPQTSLLSIGYRLSCLVAARHALRDAECAYEEAGAAEAVAHLQETLRLINDLIVETRETIRTADPSRLNAFP